MRRPWPGSTTWRRCRREVADDAPLPNPSLVPLMKDEIYISPEDEVELRVQDEYAQQDYYKFNVQVLQLQKKVLHVMREKMEAELETLLQDTLTGSSRLGAGFTAIYGCRGPLRLRQFKVAASCSNFELPLLLLPKYSQVLHFVDHVLCFLELCGFCRWCYVI
uniref:Uncharacterized protein n=1 Tax=Oryza nivara TaxID=4536 RepID=A0A0E0HWU4_ORYNI